MVDRESAMRLSPQRTAARLGKEGTTVSTLQKPLPVWTGEAMIVPVPNLLSDAWDASDSFAEAFLSVYQAVTEGYDAAVKDGRIRPDGDIVLDDDAPSIQLQKALLRGEGRVGSAELADRYGVCRQTVHRTAVDLGVRLGRAKTPARKAAEALFDDGVTSPSAILQAIQQQHPEVPLPKRNTITQWRIRWEAKQ